MIALWLGSGAAGAPAGERGRWEGEVALDALHASTASDAPSSGPEPGLSSTELGLRVRGAVAAGRFGAALDYWGREPVAGTFQNATYRLLYRAEVTGEVVEDRLTVGAGRFVAPAVVFLPVDGARMALGGPLGDGDTRWSADVFGGRRGVDTARRAVGFETLLPAVGGRFGVQGGRGALEGMAALAGDRVDLPGADGTAPDQREYTATSATVRGRIEPVDDLLHVGGGATVLQRASYVFLPNPGSASVTAQALGVFQALGYARWRPSARARVDLDVVHQEAELDFEGVGGAPAAVPTDAAVTVVDPTFDDLRVRPAARLEAGDFGGWLRPDARLRLRSGRSELRYGIGADFDRLGVPGPFVRARAWLEDVGGDQPDNVGAVDRVLWSGSVGYARGGLDAELGASRVDRAAAPVSARTTTATASDDLSPFVLAAQDVGFVRAFLTNRALFGGLDLEANLTDLPEVRAFLQVGVLGDGRW